MPLSLARNGIIAVTQYLMSDALWRLWAGKGMGRLANTEPSEHFGAKHHTKKKSSLQLSLHSAAEALVMGNTAQRKRRGCRSLACQSDRPGFSYKLQMKHRTPGPACPAPPGSASAQQQMLRFTLLLLVGGASVYREPVDSRSLKSPSCLQLPWSVCHMYRSGDSDVSLVVGGMCLHFPATTGASGPV